MVKEREVGKELEDELIMNKKKVIEQHEKGFNRVVRQVGFFAKDLDLVFLTLSIVFGRLL